MGRAAIGLGWLAVALVLGTGAIGCGDDDAAGPDGGVDGGGRGGSSGRSGAGTGGGAGNLPRGDGGTSTGDGEENDFCSRATDCKGDLVCVDTGFQVGVCARGCDSDADCGLETCVTRTNLMADAHCENVERAEFALCGAAVTAICGSNRTCLISPDLPVLGVCVNVCLVDEDSDGGTVQPDAGAAAGFASCHDAQTCIDIEFRSEPDGNAGICADEVGRGAACGIEMGALCIETEVCAPEDPLADESDYFCREDCSADGACSAGTCTDVRGEYAYCAE